MEKDGDVTKRKAIADENKRWTDNTVPYEFGSGFCE